MSIGESVGSVLDDLKARYKDKIKGRVSCAATIYTYELDLNSENGKVEIIP